MTRKTIVQSICLALVLTCTSVADNGSSIQSAEPPLAKPSLRSAEPELADPTPVRTIWVITKEICINYEVKKVGPSGVKAIELWSLDQSKHWTKQRSFDPKERITFAAPEDGHYGIRLVARKGDGRTEFVPSAAILPQLWLGVDTTPPVVKLFEPRIGEGADTGYVFVRWSATDANFGPAPISLFFGKEHDGPWKAIGEFVPDSREFKWKVPTEVLPKFYLQVRAVDLAGNLGTATSTNPVVVDFAKPEVEIQGVEPIRETLGR